MYYLQKDKNIRVVNRVFVFAAVCFALAHLAKMLFETVLSVVFYSKINVCSVAYIVAQFLCIYMPLLCLVKFPRNPKVRTFSVLFYILAVCYLLGNLWVVYYIFTPIKNEAGALLSLSEKLCASTMDLEKYQRSAAVMFNYMMWDCYSLLNVVFSTIQAFLYFCLARSVSRSRHVFRFFLVVSIAFQIAVPGFFYAMQAGTDIGTNWSITKIGYLLGTNFFVTASLFAQTLSKNTFISFMYTMAKDKKSRHRH